MTSPTVVAEYTAATSIRGKALQTMRTMLADCAAIQSLFEAVDADEALERIYLGCLPAPSDGRKYTTTELDGYRPFAIVAPSSPAIISMHEAVSGGWTHGRRGVIDIYIERTHPVAENGEDDQIDFEWIDLVDSIRQTNDQDDPGLIELHERAGNISIRQIDILEITRSDEAEQTALGDYQSALIRVYWGRF